MASIKETLKDGGTRNRQKIGPKKIRKISAILRQPVANVTVGPWPHNWAEAWVSAGDAYMVNYVTGKYFKAVEGGKYQKDNEIVLQSA